MPFFITEYAHESAPIKLHKCSTLESCLKKFYAICKRNNYEFIETETFPKTISNNVEIYFHHKTK